jgi:hypothetical protein
MKLDLHVRKDSLPPLWFPFQTSLWSACFLATFSGLIMLLSGVRKYFFLGTHLWSHATIIFMKKPQTNLAGNILLHWCYLSLERIPQRGVYNGRLLTL